MRVIKQLAAAALSLALFIPFTANADVLKPALDTYDYKLFIN